MKEGATWEIKESWLVPLAIWFFKVKDLGSARSFLVGNYQGQQTAQYRDARGFLPCGSDVRGYRLNYSNPQACFKSLNTLNFFSNLKRLTLLSLSPVYRRGNWGSLTCPRPHKALTSNLWGLSHSQSEKVDFPSYIPTWSSFFQRIFYANGNRGPHMPAQSPTVQISSCLIPTILTDDEHLFLDHIPSQDFHWCHGPSCGSWTQALPHPSYNIPNSLTGWRIKDLEEGPTSQELIPTCFPAQAPRVEPALSFKVPYRFRKVLTLKLITGKSS